MKKIIISLVIVLAAVVLVVRFSGPEDSWICADGSWVQHGNPSSPAPTTTCGTREKSVIDFVAVGHLVKDNPGMKPGVWYVVYEQPGAAALSAELAFDEDSQCVFNARKGQCPDILLLSSALTRIQGTRQDDGTVRVALATSGSFQE